MRVRGQQHSGLLDDRTLFIFAHGIDECKINVGNGPTLPFGADTGRGFLPGMRHRSSEVIIDETIGFIERHKVSYHTI
jgi:hypothetical protein